ncbi:ankyrin repeat protein, putative [Trichomonas vaginalis G3]|uniref:Ankyrin repeat protein, putative n=1 Tax=Trichomonas vaginalis (strain ATCC PRA-98 / G3) TaxID=412133 RepID=A2ECZ8_TRIV3|nr:proteasome regulatory particle assembly [Trichomonas vaginalis G3]EAY09449.1 ankyrin repeat protein, putative [Trichomonas vaginalis G3]KAI5500655.1 proteasome regulatory particle assembly [Trichomonas vaginalis G3]|eukprot:XP_001321672.1 ankyrin repeat protein [Trichomonas vaginalis G3]
MNEYNLRIDLKDCAKYNNLDAFLVYLDFGKYFVYSLIFNIPSLFEYFLSHGVSINEKNEDGATALHNTAQNNSLEIAELLILHGANINEKDYYGETALLIATFYNSKEITELLISHGANINEKDGKGSTALHYTAQNNSLETAELLILHGANINEKDEMVVLLSILQQKIIVKKQLKFLFHMVQISMKEIKKGKPLFILQHVIIEKKQLNFLFHMVQKFLHKTLSFHIKE